MDEERTRFVVRRVFYDSPPRGESRLQRMIRINFWISVAALVGMILWSYALLLVTGEQIAPIGPGGRYYHIVARNPGGAVFVMLEGVLAWLFYRKGGNEARGAAAFAGLYLIAGLLVLVGSAAPGEGPNGWVLLVILYAIGSHLLYAVAGSRR